MSLKVLCRNVGQLQSGIFAASAAHQTMQPGCMRRRRQASYTFQKTAVATGATSRHRSVNSSGKFEAVGASEDHPTVAYAGFRDLQLGAGKRIYSTA